ncbi:hypothetical protein A7979_05135 [Rothia nasimurium]|uniref:Galactose mutarotase n=1 Tax=Rothia nasimurium TaxID=85336 RepID=A0A1Y1RN24_9MICC|nr:hypothetical protein [Rothia nasimurium]ORC16000.1 hypothetical protein A7979_05135 [Rothia nasimurium]
MSQTSTSHHPTTLKAGGYTAVLSPAGARLVNLTTETGSTLVLPATETGSNPGARGEILAPWVNRISDGTYRWLGQEYKLPLNEPDLGNAIHGLVRDQLWNFSSIADTSEGQAVSATLRPLVAEGYPFTVSYEVIYHLSTKGLSATLTARNEGNVVAPYAAGAHPYLTVGTSFETKGILDRWTLQLPARTVLKVNSRMIPLTEALAVAPLEFTTPQPLAGLAIDHAFGSLQADSDGAIRVSLTDQTSGTSTVLTAEEGINWIQIYTDGSNRRGVAVEPMTSPANTFNSGIDLITLEPGATHRCSWRIEQVPAA